MSWNIRIVSSYPPRRCGLGTFSRDLASALGHFTGEVNDVRIAAINKDNMRGYGLPVDIFFGQYSPREWDRAATQIIERADEKRDPTAVLLQHEYGLDPDPKNGEAKGNNFVNIAQRFRKKDMYVFTFLHTVLENPDEHQKKVIHDLGNLCDGLIVTTESAINIINKVYGVPKTKLKHIDHGIRLEEQKQNDRLEIKKEIGAEDMFLKTTLGMISPGKGVHYSIAGHAKFLKESLTKSQREKVAYLIAGKYHPEFVRADGGKYCKKYEEELQKILELCGRELEGGLKFKRVRNIEEADFRANDVVHLDSFLSDDDLIKFYGATNQMDLAYLNMQQISSGILADTLGSGRVAVATKFRYARGMLNSKERHGPGMVITNRGILVDSGNPETCDSFKINPDAVIKEPCVEQFAQGSDILVFNTDLRLAMEAEAHSRGSEMRWGNCAWQLLQYIDSVKDARELVTGRGVKFKRERDSIFARKNSRLLKKLF